MTDSDKRERRTHFRGKSRPGRQLTIEWRHAAADGAAESKSIRAHTLNIGVGGAFIVCESPPPVGTVLVISLDVPAADAPLAIEAEVRWITGGGGEESSPGMGVKFGALDVDQLLMLSEYFASLTGVEAEAGSTLP